MKFDLKKKVMLAVLAGNMLCMGQGLAYNVWYGSSTDPNSWKGASAALFAQPTITDGCASGADLVLDGTGGTPDGVAFNTVNFFYGGYGTGGQITGNKLTIMNGCDLSSNSSPTIYAGRGDAGVSVVSGNHLIIEGGTFAGSSKLVAGSGANGVSVSSNKVEVANGNFSATGITIWGGEAVGGGTGDVTGNWVTITNGTFGSVTIYGGRVQTGGGVGESRDATGNTVDILNGTFNTDGFKLYGGYTTVGTSSGNKLNLKIKMGEHRAAEVGYFQIMNFTLPSDIADGDTMLNTKKVLYDNTTISVDAADGVTLKKDDKIYLIKADDGGGSSGSISNDGAMVLGGAGQISLLDNYSLILTMLQDYGQKEPDPPEPTHDDEKEKAPVEGVAAAAAIVNASADLASGEGMSSLVANTAGGTDTFGAMSAGSSKYKTGSHVDVDGWGVIVGAGTTKKWDNGNATTYGLFFEYGKGDFDTYNGNVHGDGNSENKGVGIMIRHQLENNIYFEGNVRYGKQETEWSESELGGYETDSKYYGAMVGFGKIYKKGNNKLDTYLRYAYGHVGACDATLKDSDYHFESVKSHRVRTGVRYTFGQRETGFKPYIGAAWEREFNGEAKASIRGMGEAPAPSVKGNTGIFELGFDWDDDSKWVVGLGANAYIGKRKGWDGMARVFYNF